jgi:hypothetical protein
MRKKLQLKTEVVRQLMNSQMRRVHGGIITDGDTLGYCGTTRCSGDCDGNDSWAPYVCGSVFNSACATVCYGPCATYATSACCGGG